MADRNLMGMGRRANMLRRAYGGDRAALLALVREALPKWEAKLDELQADVDQHRRDAWDGAEQRAIAFGGIEEDGDGELVDVAPVPEEAVIEEFGIIYKGILRLTTLTPLVLVAQDEETRSQLEAGLEGAAHDLFIHLHDPQVRYTILAGFRPELREPVDELLDKMALEAWGTIDALLTEDEIDLEDFPPETHDLMQEKYQKFREG